MKFKRGIPTTASMGATLARTGVSGKTFLMSTTYGQERHLVVGVHNALIVRDNKHWESDFEKLESVLEQGGLRLRLVCQPNGMKHGRALVLNPTYEHGFNLLGDSHVTC